MNFFRELPYLNGLQLDKKEREINRDLILLNKIFRYLSDLILFLNKNTPYR